jgi:hypothetical protein
LWLPIARLKARRWPTRRDAAERIARAAREKTGATHALAVPIEVDDGPDRIDFGGSIHLAIAAVDGAASRRSRIYGGRDWVRSAPRARPRLPAPLPAGPAGYRA